MTLDNNNLFDGEDICFDIDSDVTKILLDNLKLVQFPQEALRVVDKKTYIFGIVRHRHSTNSNLYQVFWEYTDIPPIFIASKYILDALLLAKQVK